MPVYDALLRNDGAPYRQAIPYPATAPPEAPAPLTPAKTAARAALRRRFKRPVRQWHGVRLRGVFYPATE